MNMSPQFAILCSTGFANLEPDIKTENRIEKTDVFSFRIGKRPGRHYEWSAVHSRPRPEFDVFGLLAQIGSNWKIEKISGYPATSEFQEIVEWRFDWHSSMRRLLPPLLGRPRRCHVLYARNISNQLTVTDPLVIYQNQVESNLLKADEAQFRAAVE
jgi:hypothetical protein